MVLSAICSGIAVIHTMYQYQHQEKGAIFPLHRYLLIPVLLLVDNRELWKIVKASQFIPFYGRTSSSNVGSQVSFCSVLFPSLLRVEFFTCKNKNPWQNLHFKLFFQFLNKRLCDLLEKFDLKETLEGKEIFTDNHATREEGGLLYLGERPHGGSKVMIKHVSPRFSFPPDSSLLGSLIPVDSFSLSCLITLSQSILISSIFQYIYVNLSTCLIHSFGKRIAVCIPISLPPSHFPYISTYFYSPYYYITKENKFYLNYVWQNVLNLNNHSKIDVTNAPPTK